MNRLLPLLLVLASTLAAACRNEPAAEPAAQSTAMGGPMAGQQMPPHPMGSMADPSAAGLTYELPQGWNRVPPGSMRVDQATIPGEGGSAEMAVFFFGEGSGGGVQANLDRWAAQVDSPQPPVQDTFETNGLRITWMDVSGTLKPSSMGMGPATDQPNSRMLAAVVEGPGGPWFFKITGPEQTLAGQRENFLAMLRSARPAGTGV